MRMREDDEWNQEKEEEGRTYGQVFMSARGRLCEGSWGSESMVCRRGGNEQSKSVLGTNKSAARVCFVCLCVRESKQVYRRREGGRRMRPEKVCIFSFLDSDWLD